MLVLREAWVHMDENQEGGDEEKTPVWSCGEGMHGSSLVLSGEAFGGVG